MADNVDLLRTIQSDWEIDRDADDPIHVQIRDRLAQLIRTGVLRAGDRVPSERTLAEGLGISRATARSALDSLAEQKSVHRGAGRAGTMVSARISHDLNSFTGFTAIAQRSGFEVTTRLLYIAVIEAEEACAEALGVRLGEPVYRVRRVRLVSGEPSTVEDSQFPEAMFPDLLVHDLRGSIYDIFDAHYSAAPTRSVEAITAVAATQEQADVLEIAPAAPLLRVERVAFHDDDIPCEYSVDLHRTDQVNFVVHGSASRPPNISTR